MILPCNLDSDLFSSGQSFCSPRRCAAGSLTLGLFYVGLELIIFLGSSRVQELTKRAVNYELFNCGGIYLGSILVRWVLK